MYPCAVKQQQQRAVSGFWRIAVSKDPKCSTRSLPIGRTPGGTSNINHLSDHHSFTDCRISCCLLWMHRCRDASLCLGSGAPDDRRMPSSNRLLDLFQAEVCRGQLSNAVIMVLIDRYVWYSRTNTRIIKGRTAV